MILQGFFHSISRTPWFYGFFGGLDGGHEGLKMYTGIVQVYNP